MRKLADLYWRVLEVMKISRVSQNVGGGRERDTAALMPEHLKRAQIVSFHVKTSRRPPTFNTVARFVIVDM
jgi:hypothetical protein